MMTLTESAIELAGATGIDCLIAHHPIAEGSNTGGVTARDYFNLYHLAVLSCTKLSMACTRHRLDPRQLRQTRQHPLRRHPR